MASILRSGKFLRYFAGFTRNVVVNSVRDADSGNVLQNSACMCNQFQHGFASTAVPKQTDLSLDRQLRRLDQDVRRVGRISRRDIEEVLEEIRAQRSATSSQSLLVIRCCGNLVPEELPEVRTALVQEIWKTLNALNVPMDISHYNALLRVYLENEHPFSPTDFLTEIESKSIEPNRVTYQRLIARYCQQGDIDGATRILEYMREKKLPVNENVFNSLILGHSQANDIESARGILAVMNQANLEPSADTYSTLLCCYARHGDVDAILKTLQECEQKEILLLGKDLLDVVYSLTVHGHGDKVDLLLSKLRISTGFNQDAVNVILRLVNKGYEDVALKVLRLMPRGLRADGKPVDAGSFFIRQMVKANRPVEKILSVCKTLQDEGLNSKALLIATEAGLLNGAVNNALPFLQEMKNAGMPIRQHYFWPILCAVESNQIIDIVRRMQEEFSLNPNAETIRDYVIPNLKEKNWDKVVTLLRDVGITNGTAASSAAYVALSAHKLKNAANIMEAYRANYMPQLFRQPLIIGLGQTNDVPAFIRIVRQIYESGQRRQGQKNAAEATETVESAETETDGIEVNEVAEEISNGNQGPDFVGQIVLDVVNYFRSNRIEILERILPALVEQGLSISNTFATRISDRIASKMTPNISELLGKLSSGELEPAPLANTVRKRTLDSYTVEELERLIANVEARGENTNNLKRHLLNACFRSKNLEKTLQVVEQLEEQKYVIPMGVWAQLIDMYVEHERTNDALQLYEKLKTKDAEFQVDNLKTLHVAQALLKEERVDDALKFIEQNKKAQPYVEGEGSFNYISTIWRMLNELAEAGNTQTLQRLFDALIAGNYVLPNNVILGPLIKVHLIKDDIEQAVATFERICEQYKCTPCKNDLACRLIQKEDAANLQKLTDLSTNIHGEVNSLYDLVFSFVECGRIRQARKILETPGLRARPHRIDNACERYKNEGMVQPLEGLVEATKDLNHIDRNKIYYSLLLSYDKSKDADKALGLWTKMQEESITPSDMFLLKLAELLKQQNIEVPFVVPQSEQSDRKIASQTQQKPAVQESKPAKPVIVSNTSAFRKAIRKGDIEEAITRKAQFDANETVSPIDMSHLIELLVRAERLTEATKYVNEMFSNQRSPQVKVLKFYLNKLAASGDVETVQNIGTKLSDEQKKVISYDNRLCHANIAAGKSLQYLQHLEDEVSAAKSAEEVAKLAEKFPRGGALGILEKHPELTEQYEKLADKYAKQNQIGPINVLWMHLLTHGDEVASQAIWDKYLSNAPRLMFQRVLQTAREQKDVKIAQTIIAQLRQSKISEGAVGNAYSCLIDIHTVNGNSKQALETLNTAVKDVCLENINRSALQRLKTALEAEKQEFPYTIPEKKNSKDEGSSSSQSSDDDAAPKQSKTRPTKATSEPKSIA